MAFVDPNEQNPNGPQAAQQQSQQAPVAAGGAGVGGASKPSAATPGVNVPAQPSAQLSAYLSANQPQATAFGQNVAQTVGGQINAAGQSIQPAVDQYTGNLYTVKPDAAVNQAVATSPSSLTPEQQATYKTELGAAGKAPNAANTFETTQGYQDATQKIQGAVEQANLWNSGNSVPALTTALAPFEGGNATSGDRALDALLLSRTPQAYNQIKQAVAPAAGFQGSLAAGTDKANAALRDAIAQDTATTPAAQGAAQTYAKNLNDYLNQALNAGQSTANSQQAENANLATNTASGTITAADAVAMGIPPEQAQAWVDNFNQINGKIQSVNSEIGDVAPYFSQLNAINLSPVNLSSYLTPGQSPNISLASVATPANYDDISALQALMGSNTPALPINASTVDQAGQGLNVNAADKFDLAGLNSSLRTMQSPLSDYEHILNNIMATDSQYNLGQRQAVQNAYGNIGNIQDYLNAMIGAPALPPAPATPFKFSPFPGQSTGTPPPADQAPVATDPTTNTPIVPGPGVVIDPGDGVPYDPVTGLPIWSQVGSDYFGTPPAGSRTGYRTI